ncbi:MAG: aldehyde dehydrogenase family protein [Planctomycetaceae bacterium]|nr:MAG: aldehyde dehydrogenase family protein [Planctomycetaceae bacterium]
MPDPLAAADPGPEPIGPVVHPPVADGADRRRVREPWQVAGWADLSAARRCRIVASARRKIAGSAEEFIRRCENEQRTDPVETLTGELFPLCSALRFIGRRGPGLLKPRRYGFWGRPLWLLGVSSEVRREPLGEVLILAAWNYPLLLPGVQAAQALAAGNRVWLKPAPGCESATELLVESFISAGVPAEAIRILPAEPAAAVERIDQGVDLVILTGSSATGRSVLGSCAGRLTPAIMELSGCDAVVVGPDADLDLVAKAIGFGLRFNAGATCIGPRRILVGSEQHGELVDRLRERLSDVPALTVHPAARASATRMIEDSLGRGAVDLLAQPGAEPSDGGGGSMRPMILDRVGADWPIASADLFAPVASILRAESDAERIGLVRDCPYRLAASVFGERKWAESLASRLDVGHVSINDLIFPTADPRVPFGGAGESGFGVTRGAEGLLAMTRPKVIARHRGWVYPHLSPRGPRDLPMLLRFLRWLHGR